MSLISKFMMKSVLGSAGVDELTLEPDTGRSILVKDILTCPEADRFLNVKIAKTQVGYFRIDNADLGSHLSDITALESATLPIEAVPRASILRQMEYAGIFDGYPVAEGEKMVLTHDDGGNLGNTVIVYEEYENGDITPEMQNGTNADEYIYVNYGRHTTAPAAAGSFVYDNQITPVEFPEFPFGKVVPANKEISVMALLASDRGIVNGTDDGLSTTYYALKKGRETLFDEDLNGILAVGNNTGVTSAITCELGASILGEGSHLYQKPVFFFPDPLIFGSGEELNVYATYVAAAGGAAAISLIQSEIGIIQRVKEMV
jgi:hypothetical protein